MRSRVDPGIYGTSTGTVGPFLVKFGGLVLERIF